MAKAPDAAVPLSATMPGTTKRLVALALLALAFAGFSALGVWQVQRLHWKHALIARVEARIHAVAVSAPNHDRWPAITAEGDEYRRVHIAGRYLQDRDVRVQALTALGGGHWILSPLQTVSGDIVLINRGFVPDDETAAPPPLGSVRVEGLLRLDEPGGSWLRRNRPEQARWYSRDTAAIARARGLAQVAPYFIDTDQGADLQAWPRGGMTVVQFRDQHLQYALTWFALAVLTLFGAKIVISGEGGFLHHARNGHADTVHQRRR